MFALVVFIGPARLVRGAYKWAKEKKRYNALRVGGQEAIEKMSEAEANQMTKRSLTNLVIRLSVS